MTLASDPEFVFEGKQQEDLIHTDQFSSGGNCTGTAG